MYIDLGTINSMKLLATLLSAVVLTSAVTPNLRLHTNNNVGADFCKMCINFSGQAINELLNIILNMGVVGTCADICGLVEQKTGSEVLGAVCNILCDIAGVEEFVKLVEKADLDPIYLCELLKTCPVFDGGDATLTQFAVNPSSGPQGKKTLNFNFVSKNGTGTGEIYLFINTVDKIPVELCNGECGSKHPHSRIYDTKNTTFTITN
ncbi:countin-1 [Biomphalaria pfeifferi]|uniref:Countin-1 n=1 Tax=Biomphalaria pfeifferi TaxID=112525 RepID=A0AAD8BVI7_BIOPF|nr:countin-1 [Biomphalaria pfeifferi]